MQSTEPNVYAVNGIHSNIRTAYRRIAFFDETPSFWDRQTSRFESHKRRLLQIWTLEWYCSYPQNSEHRQSDGNHIHLIHRQCPNNPKFRASVFSEDATDPTSFEPFSFFVALVDRLAVSFLAFQGAKTNVNANER